MNAIFNSIYTAWNQVFYTISNIGVFDVIDIAIVAFLIYKGIGFLRETRAGQLIKGIVVLLIVYLFADWFNLPVLRWLLTIFVNSALVLLVVVFQPELRRLLERVGQSRINPSLMFENGNDVIVDCIDKVCVAAGVMQSSKTGALIVFERNTQLGDIINSGTVVDAAASVAVINNIFFPKSPLHDGAVIIRDGRVYAAGCILPLSNSGAISSQLGTRHRAAVGMTENSDAVVLVVSEETGNISIVANGTLKRDFNVSTAAKELKSYLVTENRKNENNKFISTIKRFSFLSKTQHDKGVNDDEK